MLFYFCEVPCSMILHTCRVEGAYFVIFLACEDKIEIVCAINCVK